MRGCTRAEQKPKVATSKKVIAQKKSTLPPSRPPRSLASDAASARCHVIVTSAAHAVPPPPSSHTRSSSPTAPPITIGDYRADSRIATPSVSFLTYHYFLDSRTISYSLFIRYPRTAIVHYALLIHSCPSSVLSCSVVAFVWTTRGASGLSSYLFRPRDAASFASHLASRRSPVSHCAAYLSHSHRTDTLARSHCTASTHTPTPLPTSPTASSPLASIYPHFSWARVSFRSEPCITIYAVFLAPSSRACTLVPIPIQP